MSCMPWDLICILSESISQIAFILWLVIKVSLTIVGFGVGFFLVGLVTDRKGYRFLGGIWLAYFFYKFAEWLALFSLIGGIALIVLSIFTPILSIIAMALNALVKK